MYKNLFWNSVVSTRPRIHLKFSLLFLLAAISFLCISKNREGFYPGYIFSCLSNNTSANLYFMNIFYIFIFYEFSFSLYCAKQLTLLFVLCWNVSMLMAASLKFLICSWLCKPHVIVLLLTFEMWRLYPNFPQNYVVCTLNFGSYGNLDSFN